MPKHPSLFSKLSATLAVAAFIGAAPVAFAAPAALARHYTLRLGTDQEPTNFSVSGDRQFASDLKKLTNGHVNRTGITGD